MKHRIRLALVLTTIGIGLAFAAGPAQAADDTVGSTAPAGIQWFGTWEQASAEAKRTGRPILLTSAAPQCRGVSGHW